ncbi:membrane protein [Chitinophaga cymbidii]|uniref:Membrane protein n=1 Tax=Chitinophaga cymbidii TaxID=1096750 RepID=A0A512RL39_9BACT|nr:membrane protein [Chitinophaga cymbidii]
MLAAGQVQAQKGVNSLYSSYGIGDLEERDYSRNFGVGSSGIARGSSSFLNELNPASYGRLPMETFFFEASLAAKSLQYNGTNLNQNAGDINFKRFAIGFKASKMWGIGVGLMPYSRVDYKLLNTRYVEGTNQGTRNAIEGTGGLNRLYFSNALQLTKNFSVGLSSALLFGPISRVDSLGSTGAATDVYAEQKQFMHNFNFTTGMQYAGKLGQWVIGAGATYRFETKLTTQEDFYIRFTDETVLFEEKLKSKNFTLPEQIGGGLSLTNGHITWLADYRRQNWKGVNKDVGDYTFVNSNRYSGGMEYTFQKFQYNKQVEGLIVQAGINYHTAYMQIKNEPVRDFGVTVGASLPSRTGHLRYYLGLEAGQRGTSSKGLIQENFVNVVLHLSLRDNWFYKLKEL